MATRNLTDELGEIPGVLSVELTLTGEDAPLARVWLDGTRDGEEVREHVGTLLGGRVPVIDPTEPLPSRRGGLGKGLDSLLPDVDQDRVPAQLKAKTESRALSVQRVAVVESRDVVTVEIEDGAGNIHTADVGPSGSIDDAVLEAAAELSGASDKVVFGVSEVEIDGARIVVVSARAEGGRSAGACPVEFGRPFAVARAARQALDSLS
ncbi:MAG: hypothetical protein DWP92_02380 [Armatimonadetes bacterium]|nr:MAG: hypothetical protein DWP92_02380 [Armatimonadota bacterium]